MKRFLAEHRLQHLLRQRHGLTVLCALLMLTNCLQALALFLKSEHVVITPPTINQAFWVERHQVSNSYLEEMAVFLSGLALSVSAGSAPYQHEVLLRYATPEAYSPLKAQLLEEAARLKKDNIATIFRPHHVKVDGSQKRVELTGDLLTYVGDRRIQQRRETYVLVFHLLHGQLQLQSFQCQESQKNG